MRVNDRDEMEFDFAGRVRRLELRLVAVLVCLATATTAFAQSGDGLPRLSAAAVDTIWLDTAGVRGIAASQRTVWLLLSDHQGLSVPESTYRAAIARLNLSSGALDTLVSARDAFQIGLASDGEFLWAGGNPAGGEELLYQIDPRTGEITLTLPAVGYHPGGLVWDEEYLWQVDSDAREIARIETEEGKLSRRSGTMAFYPTGLAFDGFHFWIADASTGRIERARSHNGRADGVLDEQTFLRPGASLALAWDGRLLWVAASDEPWIVRYEILR